MRLPSTATAMALAYELGVCSRDDVATWVGARAESLDVLPDALLELTTLRHKDENEIIRLLEELGPRMSDSERATVAFGLLGDAVVAGRLSVARAFGRLYAYRDDLPDDEGTKIYELDYAFDMADGSAARLEAADADARAFFERAAMSKRES